jgi:hypothetical protein
MANFLEKSHEVHDFNRFHHSSYRHFPDFFSTPYPPTPLRGTGDKKSSDLQQIKLRYQRVKMIPITDCARSSDFLKQKKHSRKSRKYLKLLVRPAGFEPAAYGFEEQES